MERTGIGIALVLGALLIGWNGSMLAQAPRRFPLPRAGAVVQPANPMTTDRAPATTLPEPASKSGDGVLLLDEAGTPLRLTLSGIGHARVAAQSDVTPYPTGWESALTIKAQPNKSLWFDVRLDMNQQRIGETYGRGQFIYPRVSATWVNEIRDTEFYALTTRVGDLRKMTAGKGLFYKDHSEEGVALEMKGKTQSFSIAYLTYGLVSSTDVVIGEWSNADRTLGVYGDYVQSDALGSQAKSSRVSLYGRLDVGGVMAVDWESAGVKYSEQDAIGSAVLIAPSKVLKLPDTYLLLSGTYRGYYGSTVSGIRSQLNTATLATVRSDLFDEDLDWESYRSVIAATNTAGEVQSVGMHLKIERLLFGNGWIYGEYEWTRVIPHIDTPKEYVFWSTGLKAALSQHHYAYAGIQTKFLTDTGATNGQNNQPYLTAYDPTWVAGVKFKF